MLYVENGSRGNLPEPGSLILSTSTSYVSALSQSVGALWLEPTYLPTYFSNSVVASVNKIIRTGFCMLFSVQIYLCCDIENSYLLICIEARQQFQLMWWGMTTRFKLLMNCLLLWMTNTFFMPPQPAYPSPFAGLLCLH